MAQGSNRAKYNSITDSGADTTKGNVHLQQFTMMVKVVLPSIFCLVAFHLYLSSAEGVVYCVTPTIACPHDNSNCSTHEISHTLEYYVNNSGQFFSPDKVDITLYFMCGVHNQTSNKHTDIHDLQTFTMASATGKKDVTINMPIQRNHSRNSHVYTFRNVSNVKIKSITITFINAVFEGENCNLLITNSDFYGSLSSTLLVISINSYKTMLDNCTFQQNAFIRLYLKSELIIHNCTFQSYNTKLYSAIYVDNSTVIISGSVYFFNNKLWDVVDNATGAAIFAVENSFLALNEGSIVHFMNNTGGAVYIHTTVMEVGKNATAMFINNKGNNAGVGALFSRFSTIKIKTNATLQLISNRGKRGGAIALESESHISLDMYATVNFSSNIASLYSGAILMWASSSINIGRNAAMYFVNNHAMSQGGAVYAGVNCSIFVNHSTLQFINNSSPSGPGGALVMSGGSMMSINDNAKVVFRNNSVNDIGGGAVYAKSSDLLIKNSTLHFVSNFGHRSYGGAILLLTGSVNISNHANVFFINNSATKQGGAICIPSEGYVNIDTSSVLIFNNNSGLQGGALYMSIPGSMRLGFDSVVRFTNNSASDKGGALYAHLFLQEYWPCFLYVTNYHSKLQFEENTAKSGVGTHIYGASIRNKKCRYFYFELFNDPYFPYCGKQTITNISFITNLNDSLSPVSSDPQRICLCDINGRPQCTNLSQIFVSELKIFPGETFNISMVAVGQDFGVTTGQVYASFIPLKHNDEPVLDHKQYNQWISASCSNASYTVYSGSQQKILYLQTRRIPVQKYGNSKSIQNLIISLNNDTHSCISPNLLETPVFINITLLECPKGFIFQEQLRGCACYTQLINNNFNCYFSDNKGYLHWNSSVWVGENNRGRNFNQTSNGILLSLHCPINYCESGEKRINLDHDPDLQCAFNHAGTMCGSCKKNYTLAIGSSRCIKCSSDSYLALFIFFVIAGLLLVIFMYSLDLTVSKGLINGLIFYANIVWAYKNIFTVPSKQQNIQTFFKVFIAWFNLDLGIETCFVVGLDAFWKTWLQFLFPLYIWIIAGGIIFACRYSLRLTRLVGDRAVPLLATLFYLSYMKLLRTAVTVFGFVVLSHYPDDSKRIVWTLDGNLPYCQHPHIYLFVTSIVVLVIQCIPFTLFLLFIRCWMRASSLWPLRWINKFTPVYDACFAPLNDNHRHLFGVLLLIRGMLLAILTLTMDSNSPRTINLLLLFITTAMLLLYVLFSKKVYKSHLVKIFETSSLVNLIFLSSLSLYASGKQTIIFEVSIGFAIVQFCVIVLVSFIKSYCKAIHNCLRRFRGGDYEMIDENDNIFHERVQDPVIKMPATRNTTATY